MSERAESTCWTQSWRKKNTNRMYERHGLRPSLAHSSVAPALLWAWQLKIAPLQDNVHAIWIETSSCNRQAETRLIRLKVHQRRLAAFGQSWCCWPTLQLQVWLETELRSLSNVICDHAADQREISRTCTVTQLLKYLLETLLVRTVHLTARDYMCGRKKQDCANMVDGSGRNHWFRQEKAHQLLTHELFEEALIPGPPAC